MHGCRSNLYQFSFLWVFLYITGATELIWIHSQDRLHSQETLQAYDMLIYKLELCKSDNKDR